MRIPIYILTGFLGSGKTTLLNRCLADARFADSAILINEFGEIALDHLLITSVDEEVLVLDSGCVCCSVRDDFTSALLDLAARREHSDDITFQRVVLETTGIADPNVIHQVILSDPEVRRHYRHAGTVTVADAVFGRQTLDQYPEATVQVAVADGLLVSKTELATSEQIAALEEQLGRLNATALRSDQADLADMLDRVAETSPDKPLPRARTQQGIGTDHTHRFSTFVLRHPDPIEWDDLKAWLEALLFARGSDLFRIKGLVRVKDQSRPYVVNSVHQALYAPQYLDAWPSDAPTTELTFIGKNFSATAAKRSLQQACGDIDGFSDIADYDVACAKPITSSPISSIVVADVYDQLLSQYHKLQAVQIARPWHRWSLHNPWSLSSTIVDSWDILRIAQAPALLEVVSDLIGLDIILFGCHVRPIRSRNTAWENDAWQFPIDPAAGAVARLPLTAVPGLRISGRGTSPDVEFVGDALAVHHARSDYRYSGLPKDSLHYEWVFQYFPASSRYIRDPSHPLHQALTERQPLINHATAPLWLVSGEDRADNDFVSGFQPKSAFWSSD